MVQEIFADTPESKAWFDAVANISDEAKNRIQIPEADTWREWLEYVEIPAEDIDEVIATTPSPESEPELYDLLQRGAALVLSAMGDIEWKLRFAALKDFNDSKYRFFYVQLLTACLPFAQEYHRSLGIPQHISQSTLADLGRNVRVHRKREGIGGLGVMWWLMLHFRGVIYQLGRLQFELQRVGKTNAESMQTHGLDVDASSNALSIHIPDFMGPMDPDACAQSLQQAGPFFAEHFPDWPVEFGTCYSWLLDPQLKKILKPTSNIIRFQDRFTLAKHSDESNESVMQFVFGRHLRELDSITPRSSLERGVIEHLKSGNDWHAGVGWLKLPTTPSP